MALLLTITVFALVAYNNLDNPILEGLILAAIFIILIFIGHLIALIARDYINHFMYLLTIDSKF
jgi:hypothetical protein